jgi:urease accessory protein
MTCDGADPAPGDSLPRQELTGGQSSGRPQDVRGAAHIGRCAKLELTFACRRGRTVLDHAYAEPPLRVGRLLDVDGAAQLTLVCIGPGVFAGDRLTQLVRVLPGARVRLVSQSALQVHPGPSASPAALDSSYDIADGAALECVWDPVIPFAGSRLRQRIDISLAAGAELFWSDALMAGRAGRGEAWQFDRLDYELRIGVDGALAYLERYALTPRERGAAHPWIAGDAHYLGTMLAAGAGAVPTRARDVQQALAAIDGVRAGVDCPERSLLVARLLARRGPPFASARALVRGFFARPGVPQA